MNFKIFLVILFFIIVLFILYLVTIFRMSGKSNNQNPPVQIPIYSPNPVTSSLPNFSSNPSVKPIPHTSGNTGYSSGGLVENYQRTSNAKLSPSDQSVFTKLTAGFDGNSDILATTSTFEIKYVNPPNELLIEITSNNANQGKQGAVNWLKQKGFSSQGVCEEKAVIYLSPGIQRYYQQYNLQFNPVPQGC